MGRLIDDLNVLHDRYAESINLAIAADDPARAERLAAEYDDEAIRMIAVREGKTHLLPIRRPSTSDSGLRALLRRRLATLRAA